MEISIRRGPKCYLVSALRIVIVLGCGFIPLANAETSSSSGAPGVNPKDNITKGELFYKYDNFSGGLEMYAFALKYDRAFDEAWGGNVELPLLHSNSPLNDSSGIGDMAVRVRNVKTWGRFSFIGAAELVMPTASEDALGQGKWQLNPVGGVVYSFTPNMFGFVGYKHIFSVAGDSDRPDISSSQPRVLLAHIWNSGYWALADAKYTRTHKGVKTETFDLEFELGTMIAPATGAWFRLGTSDMDSIRDSGVLIGVRQLW